MKKGVWTKSRRCDTNACVEAAVLDTTPEVAVTLDGHLEVMQDADGTIWVRNSAAPDVQARFTVEEWNALRADTEAFVA